uniref:ATP-dependent DNA helicase n=1 Tax=Octopus bimaculoides TaxID=37653 RepID=A0A0L8G0C5_OCTBM
MGNIANAVASSGIVATLLIGGWTAHSTFKLPFNLTSTDAQMCNISKRSLTAEALLQTTLIVWNEFTMVHRGDFHQILPIIPWGMRADEIYVCLKSSPLWRFVCQLSLSKNMRAHLYNDQL